MALFKPALVGLYEKYGANSEDAQLIHGLFGQNYSQLVRLLESNGSLGDSKVLAAVQLSDDAFFTPTHYPDGPHWGFIESEADLDALAETIRAAGQCSIAIYWHHFNQDVIHSYIDAYTRFLNEVTHQARKRGLNFDTAPLLSRFIQQSQGLKNKKPLSSLALLFN